MVWERPAAGRGISSPTRGAQPTHNRAAVCQIRPIFTPSRLPGFARAALMLPVTTTTQEVPLLSTAWAPSAVAAYLSISVRQLSYLRQEDVTFPEPRMIGRLPRWAPHVVVRWLAHEPASATTAAAPAHRTGQKAGRHVH